MDSKTYLKESEKTLSKDFFINKEKNSDKLLHGAIGLATESGEILDVLKKHLYYGNELDKKNLIEELGDVLWYMAILMRELDTDFEEVFEKNIIKLRERYGEKFSKERSDNRDYRKEMKAMEKS